MDTDMTQLTERLSDEFNWLPTTTVIRVVTDCVEQWPNADVYFIEQAARSQLQTIPRAGQNRYRSGPG